MDFRNNPAVQSNRGMRNNNPLNLRPFRNLYRGQVGTDRDGHAIFDTVQNGIRAAALNLVTQYRRDGQKTLRSFISEFAPSFENQTEKYINFVATQTGLNPNQPFELNATNTLKILQSMAVMEVGSRFARMIPANLYAVGLNETRLPFLKVAAASIAPVLFIGLIAYMMLK